MMSSRDIVLVSTATIFGAAASAIAFRRFFHSNCPNKRFSANGVVGGRKPSPQNPYDPTKRKGFFTECGIDVIFHALATMGSHVVVQTTSFPGLRNPKNGDPLETKYPYVCHAEVNAILNTNHAPAAGQRLYATMFPCNECAKIIIQSGVSEVIYYVEKRLDNSEIHGWCKSKETSTTDGSDFDQFQ